MVFQEQLQETPEYQAMSSPSQSESSNQGPVEGPVPGEIDAVVSLEKGDIEFWARIGTVILLFLIWQELKRQGARP